jgi:hypothetical protein
LLEWLIETSGSKLHNPTNATNDKSSRRKATIVESNNAKSYKAIKLLEQKKHTSKGASS